MEIKLTNVNEVGNFMVEQNKLNNVMIKSQQNLGEIVKSIDYGKEIEKIAETLHEVKLQNSELKNKVNETIEENKKLKFKIDTNTEELENINNKYSILYDNTYVLATDDGKRRELSKKVNALTYKTTKGKNSIMDKLFHMAIAQSCYRYLFDIFQVTTYSRIKISDFDIAMKSIGNWFHNKQNIKKCVGKRLNDYMNDLNKGVLANEKEKLLDKYLDRTDNGTKDFE